MEMGEIKVNRNKTGTNNHNKILRSQSILNQFKPQRKRNANNG